MKGIGNFLVVWIALTGALWGLVAMREALRHQVPPLLMNLGFAGFVSFAIAAACWAYFPCLVDRAGRHECPLKDDDNAGKAEPRS